MTSPLPGAPHRSPELSAQLASAARSSSLVPRTRHLENGAPRFTNRLVLETSPYLQQHAHNPVDWRAWGDEAFEEARRTGKPVFLSIGYATCHWCHVMEEESFEDLEIAEVLNAHYVPIKVDREERPDVDAIYMAAVQALTGSGGWPMSVWLTPDREPFFAGTYFPARDGDRGPSRGFLPILKDVAAVYQAEPDRVRASAEELVARIRDALGSGPVRSDAALPGAGPIAEAIAYYKRAYDPRFGGMRHAPKFPSSFPVRLLLRHHRRTRDPETLQMAVFTLERMAAGGLFDQLAGGFHRYSTDGEWLVPHFEKMLYDNALLALAYAEAFQVTGRPDFARVVRQTLEFLLGEMASPDGGFYSATDADSEGEEGRFFVWDVAELRRLLGDGADRFIRYYGVTAGGNFEGQNILHVPAPDEAEWAALEPARQILLQARRARVPPLRDEKVLAAWNGLAISAFAFGGWALEEPGWVAAAERAADQLLTGMRPDGRLHRTWKDGRARIPAFLEDHAFLAQGLLDLYEATFAPRWLEEAIALCLEVERRFGDPDGGGWFTTSSDQDPLLVREKPSHDGAEPSGASVALRNALRLAAFTADDRWREVAERALRFYAPLLAEAPVALSEMLLALDFFTDAPREVVLVWPEHAPRPEELLQVLRRTFLPNRALAGAPEGAGLEALGRSAPPVRGKVAAGGRATAYVCEHGLCRMPAIEPEKLAAQIEPVRPLA